MNYGEMLANSIVNNDGSSYAENATKSLSAALEAGKASDEMSRNMIANASFATDSLVKAVGTASTTTRDKDGNITTTPGTGFAGMAESIKDFSRQNYDLQNAIAENTSEYKNQTFNSVLEAQKEQYELMASNSSFKNLEASTDNKINEILAGNKSTLNVGKVKTYLTNPNLINEAVKSGELTDADAVMLKNMQQQGILDAVDKVNQLRLMKEYTDNGWLTEDNLFRLAKIRSEDPFARLQGLSTIDIYAQLAAEQRAARNQGNLTNDMFDLNYSINRNLLNGNRAINNEQYGNNQVNGNTNSTNSVKTNQANANTETNQNIPNQQEENTSNELDDNTSQYISNISFDNGKTKINFTPEGEQLRMQHINNFGNFADEEFYKPGSKTNTIWEGTKDAVKEVISSPAGWLLLGGAGGLGVKLLGSQILKYSPKLLGSAKESAVATMEYVLSDILAADGKEAMEATEKLGKDVQKLKEERNSKLSKTEDENTRIKIKKEYSAKVNELYKNNPIFGNENTSKWMKANGYSDKIQKAFINNDTKELEKLAKEVSNNKEFQKLARANASASRTALQGVKNVASGTVGSALTGKLGMFGIILGGLSLGGGMAYNMLGSDDKEKDENTYENFEKGINELNQFNPDRRDRRNWEQSGEDVNSNFITNQYGNEVGENTTAFLRSFDYEQIRKNIANDYKNDKISQKEAQSRIQRINRAQKAAEAVEFQDNIIRKAELQNPNSRINALNNPMTESPNDLENNISSRARHNAQKIQIPTTINKQLNSGNQNQKNNMNISANSGLILSSFYGHNVEEVDVQDGKYSVDKQLSPDDKVSNEFLKIKDAAEGTIPPLSSTVIKDKFVSTLNSNDTRTANFYANLKEQGIDELLTLVDTYMQNGENGKVKAYEIVTKQILPMIADTAAKYQPGSIATRDGSSRVNNKDLATLINGKKDYSVDRLGNQLLNDIEYTIKLQEYAKKDKDFFNTYIVAHLFGNSEKIKKRIEEYKIVEKNRAEKNKNNK